MTTERRRSPRDRTALGATCSIGQVSQAATIVDVSHHGCAIESESPLPAIGDRILVKLGRHLVFPARVRWAESGRSGLEFVSPMHGAMLMEHCWRHTFATIQ